MSPQVVPFNGDVVVTIKGVNFAPGIKVRMGAYPPQEAIYPAIDDNEVAHPDALQFVVPAFLRKGFEDVEIINPDGGFDVSSNTLYYYPYVVSHMLSHLLCQLTFLVSYCAEAGL